jgi:hypothetical protein
MASGNYIHICLEPKQGIKMETIVEKMNLAVDWFRYTDTNWVVYTTSDISKWQRRLKEFADPDGSLFICELNINNRNGWMSKDFWKWLRKERKK